MMMEEDGLKDVWRENNPDKKAYTWMRGKECGSWSRIDYFLASETVTGTCVNVDIVPSVQTDHSMIIIDLEIETIPRGPGVWKFNEEYLENEEFCKGILKVIK